MPVKCKCSNCGWTETLYDKDDESEVNLDAARQRNCDDGCTAQIEFV